MPKRLLAMLKRFLPTPKRRLPTLKRRLPTLKRFWRCSVITTLSPENAQKRGDKFFGVHYPAIQDWNLTMAGLCATGGLEFLRYLPCLALR